MFEWTWNVRASVLFFILGICISVKATSIREPLLECARWVFEEQVSENIGIDEWHELLGRVVLKLNPIHTHNFGLGLWAESQKDLKENLVWVRSELSRSKLAEISLEDPLAQPLHHAHKKWLGHYALSYVGTVLGLPSSMVVLPGLVFSPVRDPITLVVVASSVLSRQVWGWFYLVCKSPYSAATYPKAHHQWLPWANLLSSYIMVGTYAFLHFVTGKEGFLLGSVFAGMDALLNQASAPGVVASLRQKIDVLEDNIYGALAEVLEYIRVHTDEESEFVCLVEDEQAFYVFWLTKIKYGPEKTRIKILKLDQR